MDDDLSTVALLILEDKIYTADFVCATWAVKNIFSF